MIFAFDTLNRNEKQKMENDLLTMCQEADEQLTTFANTLHLECLEMYKDNIDGDEKSNVVELPQVSIHFLISFVYFSVLFFIIIVVKIKAIGQLLCCVSSYFATATAR